MTGFQDDRLSKGWDPIKTAASRFFSAIFKKEVCKILPV